MSTATKYAISALPLPPPSKLLIHNLTPDPVAPSVSDFIKVLRTNPSIQRRARVLPPQAHFSHVTPVPALIPWLSSREALHEKAEEGGNGAKTPLRKLYSKDRDQPMELIGLSETGLRDCLPHLDVGDAFEVLGKPALVDADDKVVDTLVNHARQELIDILGGRAALISDEDADVAFAPWSLRYSGHQFGVWAGQLGDGRAVTVHATPHPSDPDIIYEVQLKGGGRTPFSRSADGLAVVRSSIREYLCAEAMHALHIPTTRSLSLILLPSLPVLREDRESACIATRVAPSFLRIGSFEALNPPAQMFFIGGGQQPAHLDALRMLGEYVANHVLRLRREEGAAWGKELVLDVARRNARMVAAWQVYGFMHGVINTDNVSILGLTIDYGPYAFMDIFDSLHICNHSDEEGRYAYKYQPAMIFFALRALLNSLAPLIGAEAELGGKAVSAGWANDFEDEKIKELRARGIELVEHDLRTVFESEYADEYAARMRKRLGLLQPSPDDEQKLFQPLLNMLEHHRLDFHITFRRLASFRPSHILAPSAQPALNSFITTLLNSSTDPPSSTASDRIAEWDAWLRAYGARILGERDAWSGVGLANPRFVLRQWVLEEVIARVERDPVRGRRALAKVMRMACSPYNAWGAEGQEGEEGLEEEVKEERRFCGVGERGMLGFQCSRAVNTNIYAHIELSSYRHTTYTVHLREKTRKLLRSGSPSTGSTTVDHPEQ
ncbi:hypothetical protein EW146_g9443 [Bondarzewia mesenterica]|uniref:Selenoprotein O n=1 Tax=Bondarzewia mesenterica TaxID=1095465 RepID=A0A4S4LBJ0_9AGAM|nr:hypothetical protein EW146_g9443 [Bondarzewia mesenterica]